MSPSTDGWCAADIAAVADPDAAGAAAGRTTVAYTGAPDGEATPPS